MRNMTSSSTRHPHPTPPSSCVHLTFVYKCKEPYQPSHPIPPHTCRHRGPVILWNTQEPRGRYQTIGHPQKESNPPTVHFPGQAVSFREGTLNFSGYVYMLLQAQATASTCGTNRPCGWRINWGPSIMGSLYDNNPRLHALGYFQGNPSKMTIDLGSRKWFSPKLTGKVSWPKFHIDTAGIVKSVCTWGAHEKKNASFSTTGEVGPAGSPGATARWQSNRPKRVASEPGHPANLEDHPILYKVLYMGVC